MRTIKSTGPLFYAAYTESGGAMGDIVPNGKIHVHVVKYETYEYDLNEFDSKQRTFHIHDANCPEAKMISSLVTT